MSAVLPVSISRRSALDVAREAAREGGRLALERFRQPHQITVKGRGNLLTEADLAVESFLKDTFAREFPDHGILSEETASETATAGWVWVVDPIDGTRNFVSGIPFFCVNVALCFDGEPVVAVTHAPNQGETLFAERGGGAWLDDEPIHASTKATVADSVLGLDLGYHDDRGRAVLQLAHRLFPGVQAIRIPGSAALGIAYAACGRYDVFFHTYLYPWDIAAGILLVREAGGVVTALDGGPVSIASETVLAGGEAACADFLDWLRAQGDALDLLSKI